MNPRLAILAVLASAFASGVPEIQGRVGVMRVEPVWGEEELPMILIDFDGERREIRTTAPRDYRHTLTVNVIIYVKGDSDRNRVRLVTILDRVEKIMREWQYILNTDVRPRARRKEMVIESILGGDAINYFVSPNGDQEHMAARLSYEAEFYTSGSSAGKQMRGAPARNRLRDFLTMFAKWVPAGQRDAVAVDEYQTDGEDDVSREKAHC